MLDFGRRPSPSLFMTRRAQLRLLALVALLGFVLYAVRTAAEPSTWYWLLGKPVKRAAAEQDVNGTDGLRQSFDRDASAAEGGALERGNKRAQLPRTLDRELLEPVEDGTLVRASEREAYFHTLAVATAAADGTKANAETATTFASLFADPAAHRGELLSLRGHVRRVTEFDAGANSYGFMKLYEAWLFTPESGTNPYAVICDSVPAGMPRGDGILEEVQLTGYFFKKYAYPAGDGMRVAPLVLAGRLTWLRPPPSAPLDVMAYLVGCILAAAAGLAVSIWLFARSRTRLTMSEASRFVEPSREELEALRELEPTDEQTSA